MKNKLFLALVVAALLCLAGWTAHAQLQRNHPTAQLWEYAEADLDPRFLGTPKLNQAGNQGWELVAVVSICPSAPGTDCKFRAYLKRAR